jgi:PrtD family type I secretion system ABC transporter
MLKSKKPNNALDEALETCKKAFIITFWFSFCVNLLMLITPLYSLQVLDRVLSSQNKDTLLMLTLVMLVIYIAHTLLQIARSFTLIRIGEWLDNKLAPSLFAHSISVAAVRPMVGGSQNLRDLGTVKGFLTSAGINTLFDAPWSIIYVIVVFIIHPYLGYLTVAGGVIILIFAVFNAYATNDKLNEANEYNIKALNQAEVVTRNAEAIEAMGMISAIVKHWHHLNNIMLQHQSIASYRNGIISNISKFIRMVLQMFVTAIGAYLVLKNEMTSGNMIASSIIVGRALAPFDAAIEVWKSITSARKSYDRLTTTLSQQGNIRPASMALPTPEGRLSVENIFFAPPQPNGQPSSKYTLKGVSFALEPGEILAIIGPSAAGKSSLARLLTGVWKPMVGNVRLDGADVYNWSRDDFGKHTGYLPQGIELFSGTIKDNIARMQEGADPAEIVKAAQLAGVHDMILRLPNGYETDIGVGGTGLSAGQRQRVALARAFYGDPKFVVLDEPNANLDELGELALIHAVNKARERKITTIIISHRPSILSSVDKILILQEGAVAAFGTKNEIMARFAAMQNTAQPPSGQVPGPNNGPKKE